MTETLIHSPYEPCAQCGGLLDDAQRYCVFCGASRHHAADPVARYLAVANQRRTAAAPATIVTPPAPRSDRWLVLALALLPVAAAAGVLAGRSSTGTDEVVAALRAQKAPVVQIGGGAAGAGATTAAAATGAGAATRSAAAAFPLTQGWTVELRALPAGADAAKAIADARGKGAKRAGVLDPAKVRITPDPGGKRVLYSGAFHTKAQARQALGKLAHDFPGAKVVEVAPKSPDAAAADAPVAKHPTAEQKSEGAKIVQEIQATKGKKYVEQQRQLPDTIVVP